MSDAQVLPAHQFEDLEQQHDAVSLAMWVFLLTEVMFFGGLFAGYAIYRLLYPNAFAAGSRLCDVTLGALNTAVLITSSLTMALAVQAASIGRSRLTVVFIVVTMLLGASFLGIKGFEYFHKYEEHLVPGLNFAYSGESPRQVELFLCFYFGLTALHALHMIIGIGVLGVMSIFAARKRFTPAHHSSLEAAGLYWHFVDIIWIFLFPLIYLVGVHQ